MVTTHLVTAAELEVMGSDARFELIQGVLHEMSPSSSDPSAIAARLLFELGTLVYRNQLGILTGADGGYFLERNPDTVIEPDGGFIRAERLDLWPGRRGFFPGHPDIAIEVLSPTDEPAEIPQKMEIYQRTSVPLVWWIDPARRTATVQAAGKPIRHLNDADSLDGESVLPGFKFPLSVLFDFTPQH
jgi:Uma2 family endonuclease